MVSLFFGFSFLAKLIYKEDPLAEEEKNISFFPDSLIFIKEHLSDPKKFSDINIKDEPMEFTKGDSAIEVRSNKDILCICFYYYYIIFYILVS